MTDRRGHRRHGAAAPGARRREAQSRRSRVAPAPHDVEDAT